MTKILCIIFGLFLAVGCVHTGSTTDPIKPDNPGATPNTTYLNKSTGETLDAASTSATNAGSNLDAATKSTTEAKTGVTNLVNNTSTNVDSNKPPAEVKRTLNTDAAAVQAKLDETLTKLSAAQLEIQKTKTLLTEANGKVVALTKANADADAAYKNLEKFSLADKAKALAAQAETFTKQLKDKDVIIADLNKTITKLNQIITDKDAWWNKWVLGIVALSSLGCGVIGLVFLVFIKDVRHAVEFWLFGGGITIVYMAWKALFKANPYIEVIIAIAVIVAVLRLVLILMKKSNVIMDLIKTVDLVKTFTKWGDEEKLAVMKVQGADTRDTVQAITKGVPMLAPIAAPVKAGG